MELKDFYEGIGGNFQEVVGRFSGMEALVKRFLGKFKDDTSYQKLEEAVKQMDAVEIDHAAHTLKGVCSNLGLNKLQEQAEMIMLHAREGKPLDEIPAMMDKAREEYQSVIEKLNALLG